MLQIFEEREEVMWKSDNGAATRAPVGANNEDGGSDDDEVFKYFGKQITFLIVLPKRSQMIIYKISAFVQIFEFTHMQR